MMLLLPFTIPELLFSSELEVDMHHLRGNAIPAGHMHPTYAEFHRFGFKNVGLQPPKSPKMVIFGINLLLRENYGVLRKT